MSRVRIGIFGIYEETPERFKRRVGALDILWVEAFCDAFDPRAALIIANWPYTLFGIMPTNEVLNAISENEASGISRGLIEIGGGYMPSVPD